MSKGRWYICERYRRKVRYIVRPGVVVFRPADCPTSFATEAEAEAVRIKWEEAPLAANRHSGAFVQYEPPIHNPQPQPQHDHSEGHL